jgi:UDP-N-acetylglucosamine--N-acetylmuramyl-(pentapeptide) pyrophosphoryl-undecaprenol N-acetylglucosamine transferase
MAYRRHPAARPVGDGRWHTAARMTEPGRILRVAIGAGGTGGHIYPGLAVARALEEVTGGRVDICFISTKRGLQLTLVPQAGYDLFTFDMIGLKDVKSALLLPPQLVRSGVQAARLIRDRGIDVVVGMGGYPSIPAMVGARLARIPSLIHESNAVPGRANAFIARLTPNIAIGFERARQHLPKRSDVRTVGMPLLPEVARMNRTALRAPARDFFRLRDVQKLVVVSGGSLGAVSLTTAALDLAEQWKDRDDVLLVIKTGPALIDEATARLAGNEAARAVAYIDRMDYAYAAADVIVCRCGAGTVSEVSHVGVASVMVPYPHAPGDHQLHNAQALADVGAAVVIEDHELTAATLGPVLEELLADDARREAMAANSKMLDHGTAATTVARWAVELAGRSDLLGDGGTS